MHDELELLKNELQQVRGALPSRIDVDAEGVEQGLAQLGHLQARRQPGKPREGQRLALAAQRANAERSPLGDGDGSVLARTSGEGAATHLLGSYPEVLRSWVRVVAAAGLSQREFIEAQSLFALRVGFFGPTNA